MHLKIVSLNIGEMMASYFTQLPPESPSEMTLNSSKGFYKSLKVIYEL